MYTRGKLADNLDMIGRNELGMEYINHFRRWYNKDGIFSLDEMVDFLNKFDANGVYEDEPYEQGRLIIEVLLPEKSPALYGMYKIAYITRVIYTGNRDTWEIELLEENYKGVEETPDLVLDLLDEKPNYGVFKGGHHSDFCISTSKPAEYEGVVPPLNEG